MAARPRRHLPRVDSTQAEACRLLEAGEPAGFVVTADAQTAGRGREGRSFHSPVGGGLWLSVTALTRRPPAESPAFPVAMAVAAAEALEATAGLGVSLRWPNDLMVGRLKIGGVLADSRPGPEGSRLVLGLGVNLALENFPQELLGVATSAALLGNQIPTPDELLAALLPRLDAFLATLEVGRPDTLLKRWRGRCRTLGRKVSLKVGAETVDGILEDLSLSDLVLKTPAGQRRIPSGHVARLTELP